LKFQFLLCLKSDFVQFKNLFFSSVVAYSAKDFLAL
jgi:hypothetical protein